MSVSPASEVSRPKVIFSIEGVGEAVGEFHRFSSPRTADAILRRVPVGGRVVRYGEEVYFQIDVKAPAENPRNSIEVGGIAYWPMGNAVCIFYGPTKPYSAVNKLGKILENLDLFGKVKEGTKVTIKKG
ncbi:MAG TPA: cyclophilin-like fold protein [Candidatus Bathyarchaeia archaeon]|nr:cyclophilin-like fold protein [Candidatus Bathyarchaeia archaeon]HEX4922416.1 cyclophilin-like fold protein [Candidatus Bathyarchaeia archaeon]